jgi:hypothetical protein
MKKNKSMMCTAYLSPFLIAIEIAGAQNEMAAQIIRLYPGNHILLREFSTELYNFFILNHHTDRMIFFEEQKIFLEYFYLICSIRDPHKKKKTQRIIVPPLTLKFDLSVVFFFDQISEFACVTLILTTHKVGVAFVRGFGWP